MNLTVTETEKMSTTYDYIINISQNLQVTRREDRHLDFNISISFKDIQNVTAFS